MKKKLLSAVAAVCVLALGAAALKCPWLQQHYNDNVAPIVSSLTGQ